MKYHLSEILGGISNGYEYDIITLAEDKLLIKVENPDYREDDGSDLFKVVVVQLVE